MKTAEVIWKDSTTPGLTGIAVYRDDIFLAEVLPGVEIYLDATAEDGATYKYEVQGRVGDRESTEEVTDVNVKSITISEGISIFFTTTSKDTAWVFDSIGNAGSDITWTVDGGQQQVVSGDNSPVFNLENSGAESIVKGTSSTGFSGLHSLYADFREVTAFTLDEATDLIFLSVKGDYLLSSVDVSSLVNLTNLTVRSQILTSLDLSSNTSLVYLYGYDNQITSVDLGSNPLLEIVSMYNNNLSSTQLDDIVNTLAGFSISGGVLSIVDNSGELTEASYYGYQTLISRSWDIDVAEPDAPEVPPSEGSVPIMSNFRVNDATPAHVHFDTPLGPIEGLTTTGFVVSGKNIISVNSTLNYFEVDQPFTYWDQAVTIRLGENSDTFNGVQVNPKLHNFTLDSVYNLIDEPTATVNRYVAVGGSGDGTSEGNAASLSYMEANAVAGQTWWIKAGDYGNQTLTLSKNGTVDNPIKYIGYKDTTGDITGNYVANAEALRAGWSTAEFPTLTGVGNASGTGVTPNCDYVILRNFQTTQFKEAVRNSGNVTNVVFERFNSRDNVESTSSTGFSLVDSIQTKITVRECFFLNHRMSALATTGNSNSFNLFENNSVYKDSNLADQDYWVGMSGSNNNIRNNHGDSNVELSSSHGMGIKAGDSESDNNYNLIELNEAYGLAESYYLRNSSTYYNVVKDNYAEGISGGTRSGGFYFWGGTRHSIIERNKFKDLNANAIRLQDNAEGSVDEIGAYNILRNNIFDGADELLVEASDATESLFNDNKFYNNTFMNIPNWSLWSAAPWDGVVIQNLEWTNNIFENIPSIGDGMSPGQIFTNNNFNGCWTNGLGTGDTNLDPQLDANYLPSNESLKVATLPNVLYDYNNKQRNAIETTIGGVTLLSENAGDQPIYTPTYYVSNDGNDSNDGLTPETAWQTLQEVKNNRALFTPGTIIGLNRGDSWVGYRYYITDHLSGTAAAPIVYTAYGSGAKPIVTLQETQVGLVWTNEGSNIWSTPSGTVTRLWKNGTELLVANPTSEIGTEGTEFYFDSNTLYVYSTTDPTTDTFEWSTSNYTFYIDNADYLVFDNLDLQGGTSGSLRCVGENNVIVKNCNLGLNAGTGIYVDNVDSALIENNTFFSNFTADLSNLVENSSDLRGCNDGIRFAESVTNSIVRNNYFKDWGHAGIDMQTTNASGRTTNNKIYSNEFETPNLIYGRAIGYSGYVEDNEIYNNYMHDTTVSNQLGGARNHFHHNIIENVISSPLRSSSDAGSGIWMQITQNQLIDNIIENNTIINCESAGVYMEGGNATAGEYTGNIVRNNIIVGCGTIVGGESILFREDVGNSIYDNYFYNNIVYSDLTATPYTIEGVGDFNATDFNAQDVDLENNIQGDPLVQADYYLGVGSPARLAGTPALSTLDYYGNTMNLTTPDIGVTQND